MQKFTRTPARDFSYYDPENRVFTAADLELFRKYAEGKGIGFGAIPNWKGEKEPVMSSPRREYTVAKLGKNAFHVSTKNWNGDTLKQEIWVF